MRDELGVALVALLDQERVVVGDGLIERPGFPFKACGIASSRVLAHDRSIVPMCSPGREVLFPSTAGRSAIASSLRTA
jgi:hypothetical protein